MATPHVGDWLDTIGARVARFSRPLRDALVVVWIGRALWFFFVQGIRPREFAGVDARAYWQVDLAHPYVGSGVGSASSRREWRSSRSSTVFSIWRTPLWWRQWR